MIKKLSEREHILQRPTMYIGAVNKTLVNEYILENDKIEYKEVEYIPALIKIINEIIDNSVDVAIKTNFKSSNEISIKMEKDSITVQDNGTGIPVQKNSDGHYLPELCWGHARAGSNFEDDKNRTQIGMNGVGSYATNCFSNKFIGKTDDGKNSYTITFKDNAKTFTEKVTNSSGKTGTSVTFYPDLERFGLKEIDENHFNIIKQRLINLSMTFPEITFKFNSKKININSFKKYISLFNDDSEIYETEEYKFAILPNSTDDFRQFSYVNGLKIPDGGTHIDYIVNNIVNPIREKLVKKYSGIKPADIKNKLMVVAFLKNVKNTKFNSQTKEKITNSVSEISNYYGNIDFIKITNKILKTPAIIDPITEVYKIKEELKKRQELKGLDKTVKKIKSDKYTKPVGDNDVLLICEGLSAKSALLPGLGRKGLGYYELKGKPANVYSSDQKKFTDNKELSDLYKIIKQEGYKKIVVASDSDLDGIAINGLLIAFFKVYLQEELESGMLYRLNTPVMALLDKNKLPKEWIYDLKGELKEKNGLTFKFFKGLGSWTPEQMKKVIETDRIDNMLMKIEYSEEDDKTIDDWYSDKKADKRKEYILNNDFDLIKL